MKTINCILSVLALFLVIPGFFLTKSSLYFFGMGMIFVTWINALSLVFEHRRNKSKIKIDNLKKD